MGVPEEDRTDQIVRVRGIGVVVGVGGGSGRTSAADHRINIVSGGDLAGWYVAYNWLRSCFCLLPSWRYTCSNGSIRLDVTVLVGVCARLGYVLRGDGL